ncbi:hypothetical protein VTO42DRAFT_7662 [Malbranchea cinnamomea]
MAEVETSHQDSSDTIQSLFTTFRSELDEHHDRRERIIKASRDITALSKKIIFSLQRVRILKAPLPKHIAKENDDRFSQIKSLFSTIANDISTGPNSWRYHHQFSSGLQEYIEALSFQHYIEHQRLITHDEVVRSLPDGILVPITDYVLGLFDLTGELMRFAITNMTVKGFNPRDKEAPSVAQTTDSASDEKTLGQAPRTQRETIVDDLRILRALFERLNVPRHHELSRDLPGKMDTMQASVEKVERAAYGLLVRGRERPAGWMPDLSSSAPVESF